MRPTYLCIPDIPDGPQKYVDIEGEQREALIERIGLALWRDLARMEMENELLPGA